MARNLDVHVLRTLITIVDRGGFRRAARELHLTPSAVSQQIQRLEQVVGGAVFAETRPVPTLSSLGEELLGYARRIIDLNDEAIARLLVRPDRRKLVVGLSEQFAGILPPLLARLRAADPDLRVEPRFGFGEALARQVIQGRADVALGLRAPLSPQDRPMGTVRLAWYGRPDLFRESPIPLALFTEPSALRRHTLDVVGRGWTNWKVVFEAGDLRGLHAAVRGGFAGTCLMAGGELLWGLPEARQGALPLPPPVTVSATFSPHLDPATAKLAMSALDDALGRLPDSAFHRSPEQAKAS